MQTDPQITFRNMDTSEAAERLIRQRIDRLERHTDRITGCRVVVELSRRSAGGGKNPIGVTVEVEVPGKLLVAKAEEHPHESKGDGMRVVTEAFSRMERQIEDHTKPRNRASKAQQSTAAARTGRVARLYPEQDYGFIEQTGGEDLYFHRNAVHDDAFDALTVGAPVEYRAAGEEGPMGPKASGVRAIGTDHAMR